MKTVDQTNDRLPQCPHCGERFDRLKEGKIPTHDFPKPCRQVCRGAGEHPRRRDSALWKDDPEQQERDLFDGCRQELLIYGFAVVKAVGELRGKPSGEMKCPLCGGAVRYSIASCNGHCAAQCMREGCINMVE